MPVKLAFAQEPSPQPEWCVSYAWGGDRKDVVDRLCQEAEAQGKTILRDKTALGLGERISKFMQRIGRADGVFVILSDTYLKSPVCMFELSEVWRNCRQDDKEFLRRIRVYTLPCARIRTLQVQISYVAHWQQESREREAMARDIDVLELSVTHFEALQRVRVFRRNVSDILATVADVLQPRDFEDLVTYGFAD